MYVAMDKSSFLNYHDNPVYFPINILGVICGAHRREGRSGVYPPQPRRQLAGHSFLPMSPSSPHRAWTWTTGTGGGGRGAAEGGGELWSRGATGYAGVGSGGSVSCKSRTGYGGGCGGIVREIWAEIGCLLVV